jgi:5-dehydro-2-deoxygluconokinase
MNMVPTFQSNRFLVVGRAGLDLYADPPGTEIENASMFAAALGGSAANIAVAISKQGGSAALLTSVSDDAVGRATRKMLASYGVETRHVQTAGGEARNSLAVVETRAENCQSVIYRNGAADFQLTDHHVRHIAYQEFAGLIVTGTALAMEPSRGATLLAMQLARDHALPLIIDLDYRPYSWLSHEEARHVMSEAAQMCDIIVGNNDEFSVLAGPGNGLELARGLAAQKNCLVIYKRGPDGCTTFNGASEFETPVFEVKALKPTGAGDGFMGGLMSALVRGMSVPDAVARGAATAAIVVTRVGCAPAMPDAAEVDQFLHGRTNAKR